jgi:DNA-binding beta-propeller fold protein YncE
VYVADFWNHRIQKFQLASPCPTGTTQITTNVCFVTKWGTVGSGNGQFLAPEAIAVDAQGNLYTIDGSRIQKFQFANPCPTGTTQVVAGVCFVTKWGTYGSGDGQFQVPTGISVDTFGYVYVADKGLNNIQKFQLASPCPTGTTQVVAGVCFVTKWGTVGSGNGQFYGPYDVAIDSSLGNVYVIEIGNNRTQAFVWKTDQGGPTNGGNEPGIAAK